jgi:MFS family permease
MGLAGLAAMVTAIFLGVRLGVSISLGEALAHNTGFTWWVINRLAFIAGLVNLSTFAIFYLQSRLGYSQMQAAKPAAQLIQVVGVAIFLAALAGGWLGDRFGHRRLLFFSGIGAAAGVMILLLTKDLAIIGAGGAVIGLASGLFYTSNWALGTELVPKDEAARYLGISNLAGAGAGAIGAYIGGPIADFFTRRVPGDPGLGYVLLFGIYGMLFLFSTLALLRVREPG